MAARRPAGRLARACCSRRPAAAARARWAAPDYVTREETLASCADGFGSMTRSAARFGTDRPARVPVRRARDRHRSTTSSSRPARPSRAGSAAMTTTRRRVARLHSRVRRRRRDASAFEPDARSGARRTTAATSDYRTAHALAWLFVRRLAVSDLFAPGGGRSFAFLLDMNLLFEQFVTRLLDEASSRGPAVHVAAAATRSHR